MFSCICRGIFGGMGCRHWGGCLFAIVAALLLLPGCATARSSAEADHMPLYSFQFTSAGEMAEGAAGLPPLLTVGSYNLHGLSNMRGLATDLRALPQVSVWGFQEFTVKEAALAGGEAPGCVEILQRLLPPGSWHGRVLPVNEEKGRWECQVLVSRFPLESVEAWELPHTGPKRRAALAGKVNAGGSRVLVVNTDHEQAAEVGPRDRHKQLAGLRGRLEEAEFMPTVLLGDFNTSGNWLHGVSSEAEIAATRAFLGESGFSEALPGGATFRVMWVGQQLDHLFVRNAEVRESGVFAGRGSDHRPIWCRLEGSPSPKPAAK